MQQLCLSSLSLTLRTMGTHGYMHVEHHCAQYAVSMHEVDIAGNIVYNGGPVLGRN